MHPLQRRRWARVRRVRWGGLVAALFGLAYFVHLTDLHVLDVRAVDAVAAGDVAYHALARDFAQWDSWHWPLARIDNYLFPVGTSAVFTDANPWVTLVSKALLPKNAPPLQLIGPWLALCMALQGWFGSRIGALATRDPLERALAGALFVTAPVLTHRLAHDTLAAHWVILALLEPALRPASDARASRSALLQSAAVLTFAAGLHPTLFAMSLPLVLVTALRHGRPSTRSSCALLAAMVVGPAAVWISFGTVGRHVEHGAFGFGHFSANLLTLVDPYDAARSAILPPLSHGAGQYEGFGYLGAGALALAFLGVILAWRGRRAAGSRDRRSARAWLAVALAALVSAVFAFSSRIMLGSLLVADLSVLYRPIHAVTEAFRSSGRFIWPLHYVVVAFAVAQAAGLRARYARGVLAVALALQLFDSRRVDARGVFTLAAPPETPSALWQLASADYAHLVLDPPQVETNAAVCPQGQLPPGSFIPFAQIARRAHLTFNSGQAARVDEAAMTAYCQGLARDGAAGIFDPLAIYVALTPAGRDDESAPGLACRALDGARVCVRADRATSFGQVLASERGPALSLDGSSALLTLESGFGPPAGEPPRVLRTAAGRAALGVARLGDGPAILAFVALIPRSAGIRMRVQIDGRDAPEPLLRNGTAVGAFTVAAPNEITHVTFAVDGLAAAGASTGAEAQAWQLVRLEWFPAR